jgi:hypothetical protein
MPNAASREDEMRGIRLVVAAMLAIPWLAGCAGQGATGTQPASMPTASEPSAAPSREQPSKSGPVSWGAATLVHGTETCWADVVPPSPGPDGAIHVRGATVGCQMVFDDPRVSGTKTGAFDIDGWGTLHDGAMVQWGAGRHIENAGGTWDGWFSGIYTSETGDLIQAWYEGRGGYKGLAFQETIVRGTGGTYEVVGLIYPGTIPAPWSGQ